MEIEATPEEEGCGLGSGPFLFSGKPPFLLGTVNLINRSAEKVKVRSLVIGGSGLESHRTRGLNKANEQMPELQPLHVRVFGRLEPYHQTDVRAQLTVDRFTPPGEYEAQVRLGDEEAQALIFVLENHKLRLTPNQLVATAAAGQTITQTVYITNEGNVPFNTRKAVFAPLQALNMVHQSLAIALDEEGHSGHQKFLDRFVSELADNEVQPAKVKLEVQDEIIAPGETKRVEITIRLPAGLKKKKTYKSKITFRNATLGVELDVNGAAGKMKGERH